MEEVKVYGTIRVRLKRVSNRDNTHISQDNSKVIDISMNNHRRFFVRILQRGDWRWRRRRGGGEEESGGV